MYSTKNSMSIASVLPCARSSSGCAHRSLDPLPDHTKTLRNQDHQEIQSPRYRARTVSSWRCKRSGRLSPALTSQRGWGAADTMMAVTRYVALVAVHGVILCERSNKNIISPDSEALTCRSLEEVQRALRDHGTQRRRYLQLVLGPWVEDAWDAMREARLRTVAFATIESPLRHAMRHPLVNNSQCSRVLRRPSHEACRALWANLTAVVDWFGAAEAASATIAWLQRQTGIALPGRCAASDGVQELLPGGLSPLWSQVPAATTAGSRSSTVSSPAELLLSRRATQEADWHAYRQGRRHACSFGSYVRGGGRTPPYVVNANQYEGHCLPRRGNADWQDWRLAPSRPDCDASALNHRGYCDALRGRSVFFSGDSTQVEELTDD